MLQKDYKVHIPVVKELLNEKYDVLAGIDCIGFKDDSNQKLLQDINSFLEQYYDKIRHKVKEQELKNQLSFTLITKILMGTLGCVPAYDRYFIAGIKNQKVATGNLIWDFGRLVWSWIQIREYRQLTRRWNSERMRSHFITKK